MFALLGVVSGAADRVPHHHLQFGDGNRRHHWNRCVGFGAAAYPSAAAYPRLQLHRKDSALSGRVFTVGHSSIPPYSEAVLHCSVRTTGGRALPSSGLLEGLTLFAADTGLTLRTDHKLLVWLHRFKDTEGMMSRWLHSLQQFQFSIIH